MATTTTTLTEFRDSLFTAFDTYWTGLNPTVPIAWQGLEFNTNALGIDDADAFVAISIQGNPDGDIPNGSCYFQVPGTVTVQLYTRGQVPLDSFYLFAQQIKDFMLLRSVDLDQGFMRNIRFVEIGFDGTWFQGNASADYLYFTNRAA